ncbi:MAG: hypothetical protein PHI35_00665 [Victivallaceae bacterium]|nr:hypothetical protein [Victivallaceae bacterium]
MAPSTQFRTPATGSGNVVSLPVKATTKIYGGSIVAINPAGDALPAADTAGLRVAGVAQGDVDNLAGAAGDEYVPCDRRAVEVDNSVGDPVTKADMFNPVFVEDDVTVNKSGGSNKIKAGVMIGLNADGSKVIVDFALASVAPDLAEESSS